MCKRFFEKQRVDEIGFYSVRLQKVVLYLAIFNLLGLLAGLTHWISALIEVILLWVAFHGAYKRRHRPLRAYVCINITFMILGAIFLITALMFYGAEMHHRGEDGDEEAVPLQDLTPAANNSASDLTDLKTPLTDLKSANGTTPDNTNLTDLHPAVRHVSGAYIALWFLVALAQILVFILKIISIVMAARLARMICTYNCLLLSHPTSKPETPSPSSNYIPMQPVQQQQQTPNPMYPQPMYVPVVINGQPNGQPQQFMYPNPYFVPQAMYTPMAPPQTNDKN